MDSNRQPRILVVDDDPVFRQIVSKTAKKFDLALTLCESAEELSELPKGCEFDVAVLDYYLDHLRGPELAEKLVEDVPVLLVSQNEYCVEDCDSWPLSVRAFIAKNKGVEEILDAALRLSHVK